MSFIGNVRDITHNHELEYEELVYAKEREVNRSLTEDEQEEISKALIRRDEDLICEEALKRMGLVIADGGNFTDIIQKVSDTLHIMRLEQENAQIRLMDKYDIGKDFSDYTNKDIEVYSKDCRKAEELAVRKIDAILSRNVERLNPEMVKAITPKYNEELEHRCTSCGYKTVIDLSSFKELDS